MNKIGFCGHGVVGKVRKDVEGESEKRLVTIY